MKVVSRHRWGACAAVLCLIGSAFSIGHRTDDIAKAAGQADSAAKAYRAAGLPWEAKDLRTGSLKESQNAAALLGQAAAAFKKPHFSQDVQEIRKLAQDAKFDMAAQKLVGLAPCLSLAEKASHRQFLDFGLDWDQGVIVPFEEMASIRMLVRLLCLRAEVECYRKDTKGAVRDLKTAQKLAILGGQSPTVMAMVTDMANQLVILDAIQQSAAALKSDPLGLKLLGAAIGSESEAPSFADALRGEAYIGLATIRNFKNLNEIVNKEVLDHAPSKTFKSLLVRTGVPKDINERAVATRHFQAWTQAASAMSRYRNDPEKLQAAMTSIAQEVAGKKEPSYAMVAESFSAYTKAGTAVIELRAQNVATRALLVAMQIRASKGKWPTRIQDIPGTWIDPFTQKPLKIKITADSFRIYSLGPNRKDDGGIRKQEIKDPAKKENYDDVASYPPRQIKT